MANKNEISIKLQGHEKFPLRDGWLNKGIIMVDKNPNAFQGKNGPDIFGIGNNMVKSLRYWLKAFGLIEEKVGKGAFLTETGRLILENDPYFEDYFTLWILHSYIAKNIGGATSWYMFFNRADVEDLEKEQIERILLREIRKYACGKSFSDRSVKADLDVLLNMYCNNKENNDPEEKNVSPFAQLELVKNVDGHYSKSHPSNKIINEWVVLYEIAEMFKDKETISIEELIDSEKGISKIYQLSSIAFNGYLDKIEALDYIRINRTAGLDVIYKAADLNPLKVIEEYYINRR